MLSESTIVPALISRGLLRASVAVEGMIEVSDLSRRNRNMLVRTSPGVGFFVKQAADGLHDTLTHESFVYDQLWELSGEGSAALKTYLPRSFGLLMGHHALVLERIEAAEDLRAYSLRRRVFSREIAESLGKCIALLHRLTRDTGGDHPLRKLNRQPPWILSLHEPGLLAYLSASAANLDVIKLMQAHSEFTNLLEAVRRDWNAEALIHFDLKWDNCLVHRMPGGAPRTRVRLLDWELAQFGDPWWDVGCVFASYLATWLLSMPLTADIPAQNLLGLAKYPLGSMQPAMRSFWTRYTGEVSLPVSEQPIYLIRSVRYAAARLVQLAYEQTQQSMQMPGSAICALQVALNMLKYPADAMTHLLGITPPPPRRN